jgi:RNA polymerase sigma-70 factor (ECF subfamily)
MASPSSSTIERAQQGDRSALDCLVHQVGPTIQRQLGRYPISEDDRDDLLQSTLLQVVRRIDSFRGDASFSTWLFRVTVNEALMLMRTQRRHRARLVDGLESDRIDAIANDVSGYEDPFGEDHHLAMHVRAAFDELPASYRAVMAAHYGQDMGLQEIAARFKVTESAVRSRLHRARMRLREVLADGGDELAAS